MVRKNISKQGEAGQVALCNFSLHAFIVVKFLYMSNGIALEGY